MRELVNTREMYACAVHQLGEDGVAARQHHLVDLLRQSHSTVAQTIARMGKYGLVTIDENRIIALTDTGRELAVAVTRKHRLAERLFTDVLGMSAAAAHVEACRWQHVMSVDVERRLVALLGNPTTSPWGNPIPGLEKLGVHGAGSVSPGTMRVDEVCRDYANVPVRVHSISEYAQTDTALLSQLVAAGVVPGARVCVFPEDGTYVLRGIDTVVLPCRLAYVVRLDVSDISTASGMPGPQNTVPTSCPTMWSAPNSASAAIVMDGLHAPVDPGILAPSTT